MANLLLTSKKGNGKLRKPKGESRSNAVLTDRNYEDLPEEILHDLSQEFILAIDLSNNKLTTLPVHFYTTFSSLSTLIVQSNRLVTLSADVCRLTQLRVLKLDHNLLSALPASVAALPFLQWLSLAGNQLAALPRSIAKLSKSLCTLILSDNAIEILIPEVGALENLVALHVDRNKFARVPCALGGLGKLNELSLDWLYYSKWRTWLVTGAAVKEVLAALRCAAAKGRRRLGTECSCLEFIEIVSNAPFDLGWRNAENSRTWLHIACSCNHLSMAKTLIKSRVNINALDKEQYSPLGLAVKNCNTEATLLLLKAGANVNIGGGSLGTPLHIAALKGEPWLIKNLLRHGANVNAVVNSTLNTPLHYLFLVFDRFADKSGIAAESLMLAGALPSAGNNELLTPLHVAVKQGQTNGVKWILRWNAGNTLGVRFDLNARGGREKLTPLHVAGRAGYFKAVKLLAREGADLFIRNAQGKTPRQASRENLAIFKYLRRAENKFMKQMLGKKPPTAKTPRLKKGRRRSVSRNVPKILTYAESAKRPPQKLNDTANVPLVMLSGSRSTADLRLNASRGIHLRKNCSRLHLWKELLLNNSAKLYRRFNALNLLRKEKEAKPASIYKELFTKLLAISNVGLQLEIISAAGDLMFPEMIKILNSLMYFTTSKTIKYAISEELVRLRCSVLESIMHLKKRKS